MPISWCMPQTPQIFVTCHTSPRALRFAGVPGLTLSFLKLYSPQLSHGCARAMRSARSSEIGFNGSPVNPVDRGCDTECGELETLILPAVNRLWLQARAIRQWLPSLLP